MCQECDMLANHTRFASNTPFDASSVTDSDVPLLLCGRNCDLLLSVERMRIALSSVSQDRSLLCRLSVN